jgi:hypothetical protein
VSSLASLFRAGGGLLYFLGHENSDSVNKSILILTTLVLVTANCSFLVYSAFVFVREYLRDRKVAKHRKTTRLHLLNAKAVGDLSKIVPIRNEGEDNSEDNDNDEKNDDDDKNGDKNDDINMDSTEKSSAPEFLLRNDFTLRHSRSTIAHANTLHQDFHLHERNLKKIHDARQEKSRRNTNLRMAARKKIKQTKAMSKVPMFQHLDQKMIETLVNKCSFKRWQQGDVICRQGDDADCLYVIAFGTCHVSIFTDEAATIERVVSKLDALEFFGESSLVGISREGIEDETEQEEEEGSNEKHLVRNASIKVTSAKMDTLALSRVVFRSLYESGLLDKSVVESVDRVGKERLEANRRSMSE